MTFDSRWKNPQGPDPKQLHQWAQDLIKELRKGEFFDAAFDSNVGTGLINAQLADMAAWTIKMRNAGTTGDPQDVTINGLTEETSLDGAADFLPLWDVSGAVMRKGLPANLKRAGGLQLLNSGVISSAQATLDIVLTSYTGFRALKFLLSSFLPATDDVELWMRFSTDGGSNYDATGYSYAVGGWQDSGSALNANSSAANQILIAGAANATASVSNVAAEGGVDAEIVLHDQTTSRWGRVRASVGYTEAASVTVTQHAVGTREAQQDTDAVRFLFESGDIASGKWALYGYA